MILVLLHFSSLVQRSQFFSILALQFKDLGSLVFQLFGLKVPVFSILALRFKGPGFFFKNFGTLVPVLSLATLALWHFSFTYRKQLQITLRGLSVVPQVDDCSKSTIGLNYRPIFIMPQEFSKHHFSHIVIIDDYHQFGAY
ncbi:hypothetical protein RhiirA5_384707 [Rhizophagus irregularis]|uniref:Uncharacterized protein n=1 Tax=Rhizophagus irregularis TaxID=588596 RepID=A0A2I1ETS3_9GLOM|nr:hypothetical protein RhiirA5_384707 [Rhizophagus irregularis]PKY25531.1 hypothetical protein RhiirB3_388835 [Rhizophagus irregularis]